MNHKQKIKLAKRLRSRSEFIQGKPIFETKRWDERKEAIRLRVIRKQKGEHDRAVARRKERAAV